MEIKRESGPSHDLTSHHRPVMIRGVYVKSEGGGGVVIKQERPWSKEDKRMVVEEKRRQNMRGIWDRVSTSSRRKREREDLLGDEDDPDSKISLLREENRRLTKELEQANANNLSSGQQVQSKPSPSASFEIDQSVVSSHVHSVLTFQSRREQDLQVEVNELEAQLAEANEAISVAESEKSDNIADYHRKLREAKKGHEEDTKLKVEEIEQLKVREGGLLKAHQEELNVIRASKLQLEQELQQDRQKLVRAQELQQDLQAQITSARKEEREACEEKYGELMRTRAVTSEAFRVDCEQWKHSTTNLTANQKEEAQKITTLKQELAAKDAEIKVLKQQNSGLIHQAEKHEDALAQVKRDNSTLDFNWVTEAENDIESRTVSSLSNAARFLEDLQKKVSSRRNELVGSSAQVN